MSLTRMQREVLRKIYQHQEASEIFEIVVAEAGPIKVDRGLLSFWFTGEEPDEVPAHMDILQ